MQFSVPHEGQVVRGCLSAPWKEKDLKSMHMHMQVQPTSILLVSQVCKGKQVYI